MVEGSATTARKIRRRLIERPRLTRLLDESQGRIKMLVAPAGYGKTTLARQWLASKQAVWYTATPASADVAALAAGLRAAVAQVIPGAGDALMERLSVTSQPESEIRLLEAMLAEDLLEWPAGTWLVVDDYHEVTRSAPAEKFIEHLLLEAPLPTLIVSRKRPRWASSRRILYGEIFEVDSGALAMSESEAVSVLGASDDATAAILDVAQGWPAVLSLAAVSQARPPELMAMPKLYSFLADEIFNRLDRRARRALCELALFDTNGRKLALARMSAEEAQRVTAVGLSSGFLTEQPGLGLELHPLAQTFLQLKLREEPAQTLERTVERAVSTLIGHGLWDEAHNVIQHFERRDLLTTLVKFAMDDLLATGRTATLSSWLDEAGGSDPFLLLATAELAFREGRYYQAEALAIHAPTELTTQDRDFAARAAIVAGRAAHVASREAQARMYYERAQSTAEDETLGRRAALGALVAAIELEDPEALGLLHSVVSAGPEDPGEEVVFADRELAYQTRFGTPVNLQRGREALQLLRFVGDPVARTSFRNVFGYALASTAHWDEAAALTDEQLRDAERFRLEFVVPYALCLHALVATGRREYQRCASTLSEAEARANASGDHAALQMVAATRMRSLIAQAAFEDALRHSDVDISTVTRSLHGELLSVKALALSAVGEVQRARELAEEGLRLSVGVETAINARCALAVAALSQREHEVALKEASLALERAVHTGMVESLMCAYRGCPQLIVCLLERRDLHDALTLVLRRVGDDQLLASGTSGGHTVLSLSPREKEVLALLAQGLSNVTIGQRLFISPVTVKVHVRHIFDKLGVRTRAEAALRAAQLGRD